MEIWHRISFNNKDDVDNVLDSLTIKYKKNILPRGYTVHLDIAESDSRWPQIKALTQEKHGFDWSNTIFNQEEILDAEWVRLMCGFEEGYPEPKQYKLFRQITYEKTCQKCAAKYQKMPIHLAKEPQLGKHDFFSVFWTDALFCTKSVLAELQKQGIQGFEVWPVIIDSTRENSQVISQLMFPVVAQPALADDEKLKPRTCSQCGITAYDYFRRGYMHLKREALAKGVDCQLTYEWFGGAKFREILISHRFAKIILDNDWSGVSLKPIKLI